MRQKFKEEFMYRDKKIKEFLDDHEKDEKKNQLQMHKRIRDILAKDIPQGNKKFLIMQILQEADP